MQDITKQSLIFRRGNPETDYARFVEILNAAEGGYATVESFRTWDSSLVNGDIHKRYAAVLDDEVIGYGVFFKAAVDTISRFGIWIFMDDQHKNQGYGGQFYDYVMQETLKHNAKIFKSNCADNDPVSLAFAEKRGFKIRRHTYDSLLDLTTFEPESFMDVVEAVKAQGIRFTSLAGEGNTESAQRKLFELNAATANDNPSTEGNYKQTFENFQAKIVNADWFRADGQLLAVDGDKYVGLGAIGFETDEKLAFNAFTGVDKDYRGRKIAQALKVLGAQYAKSKAAEKLETNNDSENAPMLAVNDKLGYVRQPGSYWLVKD